LNYNELRDNELLRVKMIVYLKRFVMVITQVKQRLQTGEMTIEKAYKGKWKTQRGQAGVDLPSITSTFIQDNFSKRRLVETGRDLSRGGQLPKHPPELEVVDVENLKIGLFGEEFPDDARVKAYLAEPTLDNRIALLVHISQLESGLHPSEYFDLHGLTTDYLVGKLKDRIEGKDTQAASRFLALAFQLKHPAPKTVKVGSPKQSNYFFGSKRDAVEAVKKQLEDMADASRN